MWIRQALCTAVLCFIAGCQAPSAGTSAPPAGIVAGPAFDLRAFTPEHEPPVPTRRLLADAPGRAQPWGLQIKQGRVTYSLEYSMMPGYRFRYYNGHMAASTALASTPVRDVVVTDRNCDMGGYKARGSWYWISAWLDTVSTQGNIWWLPNDHPSASVQDLATAYPASGGDGYTAALTGYVYLPRRGDYRFRFSQNAAPWYGWNVDPYLEVGRFGYQAGTGYTRTGRDRNAECITITPQTYNAGPVSFTYVTPVCHTSCGGFYFQFSTDNGATWERFPDNAFQIRTDLTNPQPVLTGSTTTFQIDSSAPRFLTRGAAVLLESPSTSATDAYDASFNAAWKGRISKVNYVVPSNKYLVINSVYGRDFVGSDSRSRYPQFVTIDNIVVDAPLVGNGLRGPLIYGPDEIVVIGAPIINTPGGEYLPDMLVLGNLVDRIAFESGGLAAAASAVAK
jgi:hypothetical protein